MVVQHNMQAVNANRMLNVNTQAQQKSTEKLSSGYRINRAGDDAAGLAISEKMRKQIKGLDRASTNAQDGISAVQTAEGALGEVQNMLQRMNELAIQSANGTNSESDRTAIQNEIDQLTTEIDRVSETTKFNETYLLKGDKAVTKQVRFQYGSYGSQNTTGVNSNPVTFAGVKFAPFEPGETQLTNKGMDSTTGLTVQVTFKPAKIASVADPLLAAGVSDPDIGKKMHIYTDSTGEENTTTVVANGGAHQDDQNALAKAIRESGLSVSIKTEWDATRNNGLGASVTSYKLELTGDAAQKYEVVALTTGLQTSYVYEDGKIKMEDGKAVVNDQFGVFTIQTKGGEVIALVTVGGGIGNLASGITDDDDKPIQANMPTATSTDQVHTAQAVISASDASAAKTTGHGESTEYFDKDGNRISNNALSKYFSAASGSNTAVMVRGDAPQVYDAVGNLTSLKAGNVNAIRDLTGALNVNLHVGADATKENKINLNIQSMSAKNLGVNGLRVDGKDSTNADLAIETIKEALQKVSDQRAELGAVQNRLEHTINNLDNVVENTEASESRIRDTDMAEEMVTYSKNNILAQAGQSMLAQANQANQGVLSLLG